MSEPSITAGVAIPMADSAPSILRSNHRSPGAICQRLWLAKPDRKALGRLADKIAAITGQRASVSVLLRAGIAALDSAADRVKAEHGRAGSSVGRRHMELSFWLANAARQVGMEDQER